MAFVLKTAGWGLVVMGCCGLGAELLASLEAGHRQNLTIGALARPFAPVHAALGHLLPAALALPLVWPGLLAGIVLIAAGRILAR